MGWWKKKPAVYLKLKHPRSSLGFQPQWGWGSRLPADLQHLCFAPQVYMFLVKWNDLSEKLIYRRFTEIYEFHVSRPRASTGPQLSAPGLRVGKKRRANSS